MPTRTLKVNEIFLGLSGEIGKFSQGNWTIFVRLDGCNLKCKWCDTAKAQKGKHHTEMTVDEIVDAIAYVTGCHRVLITGGEPLVQEKGFRQLCRVLKTAGYRIQVETNGSIIP